MNYSLSKKKAKELVEAKLSHFMGVSPEAVSYTHLDVYKRQVSKSPIGANQKPHR